MTVVHLHTGEPASAESNPDLVECLEGLLERARAGGITAMGMAFVKNDGHVGTLWYGGDQTIPMIAAISMLQHEFLTGIGGAS